MKYTGYLFKSNNILLNNYKLKKAHHKVFIKLYFCVFADFYAQTFHHNVKNHHKHQAKSLV